MDIFLFLLLTIIPSMIIGMETSPGTTTQASGKEDTLCLCTDANCPCDDGYRCCPGGTCVASDLECPLEKGCCPSKSVGGVDYFLESKGDVPENCLDGCIYTRNDESTDSFCFASGSLPTICNDGTGSGAQECATRTARLDNTHLSSAQLPCPLENTIATGKSYMHYNSSTWEKCGNLCFLDKRKCTDWRWFNSICHLFASGQMKIIKPCECCSQIVGNSSCPVDDCTQHHFNGWWDVVSPCFQKRVQANSVIYNPQLCVEKPNSAMQNEIENAVQSLNQTIIDSDRLLQLAQDMWKNVPADYRQFCPGDFQDMIRYLKVVVMITPPFVFEASNYIGVPIANILLCFLHTQDGRKLFSDKSVNTAMRKIVNVYGDLLESNNSLSVFNDLQFGWQSKCALRYLDMSQFHLPDPNAQAWGFKSYNEWFTRTLRNFTTQRPCDTNPKSLTAIGDVAWFYDTTDLKLNDSLYLKNETYSLVQIFGNNETALTLATPYIGGALLQVFFSAHKYHRYHSPTDGTVVAAWRIPGIIYAVDEVNAMTDNNFLDKGEGTGKTPLDLWIEYGADGLYNTELYLAHVATRCIVIIDSPGLGGQIALVFIGMTEISSCVLEPEITKGYQVTKGEELGRFQYGGSSGAILLSKKVLDNSQKGNEIWAGIKNGMEWKVCAKIIDL